MTNNTRRARKIETGIYKLYGYRIERATADAGVWLAYAPRSIRPLAEVATLAAAEAAILAHRA